MNINLNKDQIEDLENLIRQKINLLKQDRKKNPQYTVFYNNEIERYENLLNQF